MSDQTVQVGGHSIELSNLEKTFFPDAQLTKGDVVDYYRRIADVMLPHLHDRPLALQRYPDGLPGEGFFQKEIGDYFPDWITRMEIDKEGGRLTEVICQDAATLVYLANQAALTLHAWLSRRDRLQTPDRIVFDFDPPEAGDGFELVKAAARAHRDLLRELGLVPFVMTTGSRGLHVVVPVERRQDFDDTRAFARDVAGLLAHRHPERFTVKQRKSARGNRLFLDVMRNAYAQTAAAPYSVRARPGAPVATPLDWHELSDAELGPQSWTITNIFRRLGQKGDPWKDIAGAARALGGARKLLAELRR
jgi:bifunctional non-homologous end joining protein LigD